MVAPSRHYTFEDYLSVEETLTFFARLYGLAAEERRARVQELLRDLHLEPKRHASMRTLSKGTLQRVGIAQAMMARPRLLILDEPMSGLDPLGRRDVRTLILRLRDRGCTVFFSSHVLSDAEALCSRVAILAKGRLVASGKLTEMHTFQASGWEMVVAGVGDDPLAALGARVRRAVRLGEGRYMLELPLEPPPEQLLGELTAAGAHLVSLNPIRQTLEDFFVEQVTMPAVAATDRGLDDRTPGARR